MTEQVYLEVIKPMNQCSLTGLEFMFESRAMGEYRITVYQDHYAQWRVTCKHLKSETIVSGILFDQSKTVRFKYTRPEFRGKRLTRELFAFIQFVTKRRFYHSDNLTEAGNASL